MSTKRIPIQSGVPGFSRKQWKLLVDSLSDAECTYINNRHRGLVDPLMDLRIFSKISTVADYRVILRCVETLKCGSPPLVRESVPSPRLVGIELNPGPPKVPGLSKNDLVNLITSAAATAGSELAKTVKKKTNRSKAKKKKVNLKAVDVGIATYSSAMAPVAQAVTVTRRAAYRHSPTIVGGTAYAGGIYSDATNGLWFLTSSGTQSGINNFNVNVAGSAATTISFTFLPYACRVMSAAFLRWRIRKALLHYIPNVGSSTSGSFVLAAVPDVRSTVGVVPFAGVVDAQNSSSGNFWQPRSFDLMKSGGLRNEWIFVDTAATPTTADLRQESAGCLAIQSFGSVPASQTFGYFMLDFEIEFKDLGVETSFGISDRMQDVEEKQDAPLPNVPPSFEMEKPVTFNYQELPSSSSAPPSIHFDSRQGSGVLVSRQLDVRTARP